MKRKRDVLAILDEQGVESLTQDVVHTEHRQGGLGEGRLVHRLGARLRAGALLSLVH